MLGSAITEPGFRKVTEKLGSIIPAVGRESNLRPSNAPVQNRPGPLSLAPTSSNSSWYSGVAAVTAQIMPRPTWQPPSEAEDQVCGGSSSPGFFPQSTNIYRAWIMPTYLLKALENS